jgi:ATP-dependent Lhr-like helicase
MKALLVTDSEDLTWSSRAAKVIEGLRAEHAFLESEATTFIERSEEISWYTFAGGAANQLLARMLEHELGGRCIARNTSITIKGDAANSLARVRGYLVQLKAEGRPTAEDAARFVDTTLSPRVSKFERCLPERMQQELIAREIYACGAAQAAIGGPGGEPRLDEPRRQHAGPSKSF